MMLTLAETTANVYLRCIYFDWSIWNCANWRFTYLLTYFDVDCSYQSRCWSICNWNCSCVCTVLAFQSMNVSIRKLGRLVEHCNNFSRIWNCCLLLKMLLQYLVRNIQTLGWKHWKHTRFMSTFHKNQWTVKHELNGPRSPQNTAWQMCPSTAILLPVCQRIALAIRLSVCCTAYYRAWLLAVWIREL